MMAPEKLPWQRLWQEESPRLIGYLLRHLGNLAEAEDCAQEAWAEALICWPREGVPARPGAWLLTVARRRALDRWRRRRLVAREATALGAHLDFQHEVDSEAAQARLEAQWDDPVGDDVLRLIFTACHPVLSLEARATLALRVVAGLDPAEIARAYLSTESAITQRLTRARRTLGQMPGEWQLPKGPELLARLDGVMEVIYLMFNEGYTATRGEDWLRPTLCREALRLARLLTERVPDAAEVQGLFALLAFQSSRLDARGAPGEAPVLLADQDRRRWDRLLIRRGLSALARAEHLSPAGGPYALQAALAACHARARRFEDTDWSRIAQLYATLARRFPSPAITVNHAIALAEAHPTPSGIRQGLSLLETLAPEDRKHLYHSVRGDLLQRLGEPLPARAAFVIAAQLTTNDAERRLLEERAARLSET